MSGRLEALQELSLGPESLVGSWFHKLDSGDMVFQGVVVAEVQPGKYLCHVQRLEQGAENVQIIVNLDTMEYLLDDIVEWRFYDSEEAANAAFVAWETTRRERA